MFPDVCVTEKKRTKDYSGIPVLTVPAGGSQTIELVLRNGYSQDDMPINLDGACCIQFVAKDHMNSAIEYIRKDVEIVDAEEGYVRFKIRAADVPVAGIYYAAIVITDEETGEMGRPSRVWLDVEKNVNSFTNVICNQPISIVEVRTFLRDLTPEDNFLLDDVQFSDAEIAAAITWPIDRWNETPPPVSSYTIATFPYRYHWLMAAASHLLRSASYWYARNNLSYNSGTTVVNDKDKASIYMQQAKELRQEYDKWMDDTKITENMQGAYGTTAMRSFW